MRAVFIFLLGYSRFCAPRSLAAELFEAARRAGVLIRDTEFDNENIFVSIPRSAQKRFCSACEAAGLRPEKIYERGLPSLVLRYRKRWGIAIGLVLCFLIVFLSGRVIWDVRVEGNERLSAEAVISELRRCGLSRGTLKSKIETHTVENRVMIDSEEISWISVNIRGTVANVQIRESEEKEKPEEYDAANLVAAKDGYIELFLDVRGNIVTAIGDHVREGELLVSGLYGSETEGLRYTSAHGRVLARVFDEISFCVPLKYEKKVYTGRVFTEKYLVFFEKEIKIFGNSGNSCAGCDTIDTVEYFGVPSRAELPVGIRTVKHYEYVYESAERSAEEAEAIALEMLEYELMALSGRAELIRKHTETEAVAEGIRVVCRTETIEDIAKISKIELDLTEEQSKEWNRER